MIFSVHVPKTGGTSFRHLLEKRFKDRFATFYGPRDANTDHRLDGLDRADLAGALPRLEAEGVDILHGHLRLDLMPSAGADPQQVWMWLRDPVERTISHYFFLKEGDGQGRIATRIRSEQISLLEFAASPRALNLQSKFIGSLPLERLGFVGVTERYDDCVSLFFGAKMPAQKRVWNRTRQKPDVAEEVRRRIAEINAKDAALYAHARQIVAERLSASKPSDEGPLSRVRALLKPSQSGIR